MLDAIPVAAEDLLSAVVGADTVNVGRIGSGSSVGHDPGTINGRAKLYAQILLIPVSNGAGLGTLPPTWRKKASWRDSTVTIDDTVLTIPGSVYETRSTSPISALMPTEVMMSPRAMNSSMDATGKEYWQGAITGAP